MKQAAKMLKKGMCFCHAPTVWLEAESAKNMAALDYSARIITVLGSFNSNLTFIFDLNYF